MEAITEWIEKGKNYDAGIALLAKYSKNRVLLQNLSRKQIPAKLEYELRKIGKIEMPVLHSPAPVVDRLEDDIKIGGTPTIDPSALPDHLKTLWNETAEKYRLARATHEQIKQITDLNQRMAHVELLENYRQEIRENWDVIDTWVKEQNIGVPQGIVDNKRINANRKYLSESKKSVLGLNGAIRAKKLEAMQRRINELLLAGEKFDPNNQKELQELGMKFNG